jgi:hypothetical protein
MFLRVNGTALRMPMSSRLRASLYSEPVESNEESEMTRYLISFPSNAMDDIPAEEFPAVGEAAHAVVREAIDAGVWVFGGGIAEDVDPVMVSGDGTITDGTYPQTKELDGGWAVVDAPSRESGLEWAAKIAAACRCAQEVREFMPDPEVGN